LTCSSIYGESLRVDGSVDDDAYASEVEADDDDLEDEDDEADDEGDVAKSVVVAERETE
jgi:hypothetical protein